MAKPRQTAAVIDLILNRIDDGALLPGDPVNEKDLMDTCGVSRTPVREALIQLEADGLIVRNARKGPQLFNPTVEEFLAILEVHASLEAHAAELAAKRITDRLGAMLKDSVAKCSALAADPPPEAHGHYYALNLRFHEIVALASGNPYLVEMIKLNARKLMAHYRLRYRTPGTIQTSAMEHAEIGAFILSRRPEEARAAMIRHFNYDRETVMHMIASVG